MYLNKYLVHWNFFNAKESVFLSGIKKVYRKTVYCREIPWL